MEKDLQEHLNMVKKNIKESALKVNRNPDEIKLVAVSKNHSIDKIKYFRSQGINVFGENRVQELVKKNEKIDIAVNWHFIGHLQRNKVKYLMRMNNCKMIQSLDSWRLAREINKRAKKNNRVIPVLVEINIANDENKYGIKSEDILDFIGKVHKLENIDVQGLMTIVPYCNNPEIARPYFSEMNQIKQKANDRGYGLTELSMGMSNDYQIAIEEGATIVRIGTALFGKRKYKKGGQN